MSDTPTTIETSSTGGHGYAWTDLAELHKAKDGGGLLHSFKSIRSGTVADLIAFVMDMPADMQNEYSIDKLGDHTLDITEIRRLRSRADFPSR